MRQAAGRQRGGGFRQGVGLSTRKDELVAKLGGTFQAGHSKRGAWPGAGMIFSTWQNPGAGEPEGEPEAYRARRGAGRGRGPKARVPP